MRFGQKCQKCMFFHQQKVLKMYENDPKSIKSMGYSPCFLIGQKCPKMHVLLIVKMTQNRSKVCFLVKNVQKCRDFS
jgi:hypothetical protein